MAYPVKIYTDTSDFNNCFRIEAFIIDVCNYECTYCYNDRPRSHLHLDLARLKMLVDFIKEKNKSQQISIELIGGEPTLHPDLYDFCKNLNNKNINCTIYTNFSQTAEYYSKLLAIGNVHLIATYHYLSKQQSMTYMNKAKLLSQTNVFIDKLQFKVMLEIDAFSESLQMFDMLYSTNLKNNITISLLDRDKCGNIQFYNTKKTYSSEQIAQYHRRAKMISLNMVNLVVKYNNGSIKRYFYNDFINYNSPNFKRWKCDAGYKYIYVHADGNIYACHQSPNLLLGNINISNVRFLNHPIICPIDVCPCKYDVPKEKLF